MAKELTAKGEQCAKLFGAIRAAEAEFSMWNEQCRQIDYQYSLYSPGGYLSSGWLDSQLDLFWASTEVLKPAVYARPPRPAVAPRFSDGDRVKVLTAELLERASTTVLALNEMDAVMKLLRDDLIFTNRATPWVRYETGKKGNRICIEQVDRLDFLHEPALDWSGVGWVARRVWMNKKDFRDRFSGVPSDLLDEATFSSLRQIEYGVGAETSLQTEAAIEAKVGVWEMWHKSDDRVYFLADGCSEVLEDNPPHLELDEFFPTPRPAYGTLRRRSLVPVPDYERYRVHLENINKLTGRIYLLLDMVKMKGLIPGGGEISQAVQSLLEREDDQLIISVPAAGLTQGGQFVEWMPLDMVAQTILNLIEARGQFINDFYELSGISDIMRGATEADETYGAQQLKSQYGSVRVQDKVKELQRVAADICKIAAEIISEKFSGDTIQELAQKEVPSKADIQKRIDEIEEAARGELEALEANAMQMAQQAQMGGEQVDPAQAEQMFQQQQQEVLGKYAPMLDEAQGLVPIEDVVGLLRDDRARCFAFEVESDSTILTDEMAEKASRNEFMEVFMSSSQALMGLASTGEAGAKLAGALLKFNMAPYRAGRELDSLVDDFADQAAQIAASMDQGGEQKALIEAQNKLAEAEMAKAQAQTMKVEADAMAKQAENERKMMELQVKAASDQAKAQNEQQRLMVSASEAEMKMAEMQAKVDNIEADTIKKLTEAGLLVEDFNMRQFESLNNIQMQAADRAAGEEQRMIDNDRAERGEGRADQAEERAFRGEDRADRQQGMTERNPE